MLQTAREQHTHTVSTRLPGDEPRGQLSPGTGPWQPGERHRALCLLCSSRPPLNPSVLASYNTPCPEEAALPWLGQGPAGWGRPQGFSSPSTVSPVCSLSPEMFLSTSYVLDTASVLPKWAEG